MTWSCDPGRRRVTWSCDPGRHQVTWSCDPGRHQVTWTCDPGRRQVTWSCDLGRNQVTWSCDPGTHQVTWSCDPWRHAVLPRRLINTTNQRPSWYAPRVAAAPCASRYDDESGAGRRLSSHYLFTPYAARRRSARGGPRHDRRAARLTDAALCGANGALTATGRLLHVMQLREERGGGRGGHPDSSQLRWAGEESDGLKLVRPRPNSLPWR